MADILAAGLVALRANRAEEAVECFERATATEGCDATSWGLLGVARKRQGQIHEALQCYGRALEIDPSHFATLLNMARVLRDLGRLDEAITLFERALRVNESSADAWSMLSNALREANRLDAALHAAERAIRLDPWLGQGHLNRGAAFHRLGRLRDACVSYCIATTLDVSNPGIAVNLSNGLKAAATSTGADATTMVLLRRLSANPNDSPAWNALADEELSRSQHFNAIACLDYSAKCQPLNETIRRLAELLWEQGFRQRAKQYALRAVTQNDKDTKAHKLLAKWLARDLEFLPAERHWRKVVAQQPADAAAWINLGASVARQGRPIEATRILERALEVQPSAVEAHINLGTALSDQGRFVEARTIYERGLALDPQRQELISNALFSMHFDPEMSPDQVFAEHLRGAAKIQASGSGSPCFEGANLEPNRRLRIGYVSPDFHDHPVAYLLEPILREHDAGGFEILCYSDVRRPDSVTRRIRSLVHGFTDCTELSNEALRQRIVRDQVDILIDLAGHTAHNRLAVFASKPSPVQVSWLGYFDTTGLRAIDYRLADEASVPKGMERYFVEKVIRLPRSSNCFLPPAEPPVATAPSLKNGYVTFGCFNNPAKLTREVIATFAEILRATTHSRLVLKYGAFSDPDMRSKYSEWLAEESIEASRVELRGHSAMGAFLDAFGDIDIALDPFPYSGETTALHTLWMGVPLIAMEGATMVQRLASRVLRVAQFPQWVASTPEEYVRIARAMAEDPTLLAARKEIRAQLRRSPLMDAVLVTRDVECAFRSMWLEYCSRH